MKNHQATSQNKVSSHTKFSSVIGKIDYTLMNDYIFHCVMQRCPQVLKAFLCALLHLTPDQIRSIEILNPIDPGNQIGDKTFCLDLKLLMNNYAVINMELQVVNEHNWPERSLIYLCRLFDNLNAGTDYLAVRPARHIGILNFTLFPGQSEFYASYKLMNEKTYQKYSDKFVLNVLDLTQIELADAQDKAYGLDRWARLFKAATWEEFRMIAADDKIMLDAGETVFKLNWTDSERYLSEAREKALRSWNTINRQLELSKEALSEKEALIAEKNAAIAQNHSIIAEKEAAIAELEAVVARLKAEQSL